MAFKKVSPKKNNESPRMTIRFTQPKLLTAITELAKADNRLPSDYARNVLRAHVEKAGRV